ncbi:hypothetical protein [Streptomyces sp. NPDC057877]|uniref:hypothetical protein n=1 Tax=Streptomyces sp. NPDC057877 TaxID=3346269 RepID=UPI0036ABA9BC
MKRSSRARLGATATVGALSLALITGCSDSGDSGSDDSKASGSAETQAAKALGAAELEKLILAQGDVDGYEVEAADKELTASKSDMKADERCLPLAYVMSGLAPGDAAAETNRMVTQEKEPTDTASQSLEDLGEGEFEDAFTDALNVDVTVVTLSSYDGDGAEQTMKSVSDAVEGCAGGFTATSEGEEGKITEVAAEEGTGGGDEAVAFAVTAEMGEPGSDPATTHAEVVRHGSTIAAYYTLNVGAMMSEGKQKYTVPAVVVEAQGAKLK